MQTVLPPESVSAGRARRFVIAALHEIGAERLTDVAALLVSELVTTAVLHARTEVLLRVVCTDPERGVRVEVVDSSLDAPQQRHYGAEAVTGRGMLLVESLADAWGADVGPTGKVVWFELSGVAAA